jgi:hypothetical protein
MKNNNDKKNKENKELKFLVSQLEYAQRQIYYKNYSIAYGVLQTLINLFKEN